MEYKRGRINFAPHSILRILFLQCKISRISPFFPPKTPWFKTYCVQVGCMRQVLGDGALGWPRGMGWGGRWEGGSGWGTHVTPWLIHVNVWQKPLQYCKVMSLQLIKINGGKKKIYCILTRSLSFPSNWILCFLPATLLHFIGHTDSKMLIFRMHHSSAQNSSLVSFLFQVKAPNLANLAQEWDSWASGGVTVAIR